MRISASLFVFAIGLAAQAPQVEFEAASIHPSTAEEGSSTWTTAKGSLRMQNFSLRRMILTAYSLSDAQIEGGPKWMDSERFDLMAKPAAAATTPQLLEMLQTLLADRFKLVLHREKKEIGGYALTIAKGGMKIQAVEDSGSAQSSSGGGKIDAKMVHMAKLAEMLERDLRAPVVDATGVTGAFTFRLEWMPDDRGTTGPSLFTAIQETLGLKLESRKVMADVLIVDSAEKPADN